jgi:hypothetical protein
MKFCPVVPEICRGQVHGPRKERKEKNKNDNNNRKRSKNNKSPKLCLGDLIKKMESLGQEKLIEMLCLNVYWSVEKVSSMCKHLFETFEYVTFYKL